MIKERKTLGKPSNGVSMLKRRLPTLVILFTTRVRKMSGKLRLKPKSGAIKLMIRARRTSVKLSNGDSMLRRELKTGATKPMIRARKTCKKLNNGASTQRRKPQIGVLMHTMRVKKT